MRPSPSIIPDDADRDIYLVLDDFGKVGRAWRETDERAADRDALIRDLLDGQYRDPVRIVAFNTVEGWSRDLTEEIAVALHERCADAGAVPQSLQQFLEQTWAVMGANRPQKITVGEMRAAGVRHGADLLRGTIAAGISPRSRIALIARKF